MYISSLIMAARVWNLSPLQRAVRVWDGWDESKHPRKANGQFGAGNGNGIVLSKLSPNNEAEELTEYKQIKLGKKEYARVMSAINTVYYARFQGDTIGHIAVRNHYYRFKINDFNNYVIFYRKKLE